MTHDFDRAYWERHWRDGRAGTAAPANPYLAQELAGVTPGTALDAGCGAGAEAVYLAEAGWRVTAVDISEEVLARAAARPGADRVTWLHADLEAWAPDEAFDLVTTHYAHPSGPQLDFYDRLAGWVRPGGTLLIVGHLHTRGHRHDGEPPAAASVTAAHITERLDPAGWEVVTAVERGRTVPGRAEPLADVVVRAIAPQDPGASASERSRAITLARSRGGTPSTR